MHNGPKQWLVRTETGEIFGPFSQEQLLHELSNQLFSLDDEIACSLGRWISAETLVDRDSEEWTLTSTKTGSITTTLPGIADSTIVPPSQSLYVPMPTPVPVTRTSPYTAMIAVVVGVILILGMWLLSFRGIKHDSNPEPLAENNGIKIKLPAESDSPFVKEIYKLIAEGNKSAALKQLTLYHQRTGGKGDLDYIIPYAALLIMEGESATRAKKMLEEVLSSGAPVALKSRAHHWLGYALLSQGEEDMGEGHFLEALQLNTKDAAARFNLGRAYLKQEKFTQALDYLQLAELEMPELWLIPIYKGRAKAALGNIDEARSAYRAAIDASPDRWLSYIYYGLFLQQQNELPAAQEVLRQMMYHDPEYEVQSPAPWGFFQEKTNYNEYLRAFTHVMEKGNAEKGNPEDREAGKLYIQYLLTDKDESQSIAALAERGSLLPRVILLKERLDESEDISPSTLDKLRRALSKLPANLSAFGSFAYVLRGIAEDRMGQSAEALKELLKAKEIAPRSASVLWSLSSLYRKMGKNDEANDELKTLLRYHPTYIPAIVQAQK